MNHSGQPAEAETPSSPGLLHWPPFWFFIFLVLAVSAVGYITFQQHKADIRQKEMGMLSAIADLKVEEIKTWREGRKGNAKVFSQSPLFARAVEKWLQRGAPPDEERQIIIERIKLMQSSYGYQDIFLFDAQGRLVLSSPSGASMPGVHTLELVKQAIQTQNTQPLDIDPSNVSDNMGMIAPILIGHDNKLKAVGAAYLRTDTARFFFSLLKAPPSDYRSMELVLVRREGNEVLFLNVPAANKGIGLLRQPLSQSKLPAALAVLGNRMEADGVDYRGIPVFAALRKIPDSDWSLVTKVEQEEIYAPLQKQAWLMAAEIAVLIALTGMAVGLWWRNQRAKLLVAEQRQYHALIQTSLDGFWINDFSGRLLDANEALCQMLGYTREELLRMSIPDIEVAEAPEETAAHIQKIIQTGSDRFQTRHRRKDGEIIDLEVSVQCDAKLGERFFAFFRDITESKKAEKSLRNSEERFRIAAETANDVIYEWDMKQSVQWLGKIDEMLGYEPGEFPRTLDGWASSVHPEDLERTMAQLSAHLEGRAPYAAEYRVRRKDGSYRWWSARGAAARTPDGHPSD